MSFPLYNLLSQGVPEKEDLTITQKADFMDKVKTLSNENKELFYALVKKHELERSENKETFMTSELPYKGVYTSKTVDDRLIKTVEFKLLDFPVPLRHILYKFLQKIETV